MHNFNPRTPVWGATFKQWCTDEGQAFQSAHPYVGCDRLWLRFSIYRRIKMLFCEPLPFPYSSLEFIGNFEAFSDVSLYFASEYQGIIRCFDLFDSKMNDFSMEVISQIVKSEAVTIHVNQFFKLTLNGNKLCFVQGTFKDGVLYSSAIGFTAFCHFPESFPAGSCFGIHVIGYKYQHDYCPRKAGY